MGNNFDGYQVYKKCQRKGILSIFDDKPNRWMMFNDDKNKTKEVLFIKF